VTCLLLFARTRGLHWAAGGVLLTVAVGLAIGQRAMVLRYGSGAGIPYAVLLPVLAACVIAGSSRSSAHEFERTAARRLVRYRLLATAGLLVLASAGFWLVTAGLPAPVGPVAAVRNLAGLTGLGLLGARLLGGRLAWVLPCTLVISVVSVASGTEGAAAVLVWPMRPDSDGLAGAIAAALLVAGAAAVGWTGTREQPGDVA
jgi:hypothetical protein